MTAIEYPTITVGEQTLVVRFSLAAQMLIARSGINPADFAAGSADARSVEKILTIFAACVAENFVDRANPAAFDLSKAPTVDYWAATIPPDMVGDVGKAIATSMGKVTEALRSRLAVVPPAAAEAAS